ncbi:MAG: GNAT family N-acetyltransferase [Oscillospiraceae bacterium]|nr:GNAT family N-acetyltransferase [Oscillospiraceae bacterium]
MLVLKEANLQDIEKEYLFIRDMPGNENGMENEWHGVSRTDFKAKALPAMLDHAAGRNLKPGYVPDTTYFLWEDDRILGVYHFRHYLNDALREGAGHIGCYIAPAYRGKGFGTKGLRLMLEIAFESIPEDEVYLRVYKYNTPSLSAMLRCGGYIHHEDTEHYFVRVKKNP